MGDKTLEGFGLGNHEAFYKLYLIREKRRELKPKKEKIYLEHLLIVQIIKHFQYPAEKKIFCHQTSQDRVLQH